MSFCVQEARHTEPHRRRTEKNPTADPYVILLCSGNDSVVLKLVMKLTAGGMIFAAWEAGDA